MTDEIQRAAAERQTNHAVPGARVARVRDASETFRGQSRWAEARHVLPSTRSTEKLSGANSETRFQVSPLRAFPFAKK